MSSTNRGAVRSPNDFYVTDPAEIVRFIHRWRATDPFAEAFWSQPRKILDPSAGGLTEKVMLPPDQKKIDKYLAGRTVKIRQDQMLEDKEASDWVIKNSLVFEPSDMSYPLAISFACGRPNPPSLRDHIIDTIDIRENSRASVKGDFLRMDFLDYRLGVDQQIKDLHSFPHAKSDSEIHTATTGQETLQRRHVSNADSCSLQSERGDNSERHEGIEDRGAPALRSAETVLQKGDSPDMLIPHGGSSSVEGRQRTPSIPQGGEEGKVRQMSGDEEPVHPSQGLRSLQQRPEESGGALRQLSPKPPQKRILEIGEAGRETEGVHRASQLESTVAPYDMILTNPPFSLALEFIQKSLRVVRPGGYVVMLLPLPFFESAKRNQWLRSGMMPNIAYVFPNRLSFTPDGKTDSIPYMHAIWRNDGYQCHETKMRVLPY